MSTTEFRLGHSARRLIRETVTVHPSTDSSWSAVQIGITVTVPLLVLQAAGRPDLIPFAVFGAISGVYGTAGGISRRLLMQAVMGTGLVVSVGLGVVAGDPGAGTVRLLCCLSAVSLLGLLLTRATGWIPVPSLFLVFSTGTIAAQPHRPGELATAVVTASCAVLAAMLISVVIARAARFRRDATGAHRLFSDGRAPLGQSPLLPLALLHVLAPSAAVSLALVLSVGHPFWAAVSATVPLIGMSFVHQVARTLHRVLGTVAGAALAVVCLAAGPPIWGEIAIVAVCQVATELLVRRNYGLACCAITPMALILSSLGDQDAAMVLASDRVAGTLLGTGTALIMVIAVRFLAPPKADEAARSTPSRPHRYPGPDGARTGNPWSSN